MSVITSAAKQAVGKIGKEDLPPAKAGSGQINDLSARLKSCPDAKRAQVEFFSSL
jgi:hypothetical protein